MADQIPTTASKSTDLAELLAKFPGLAATSADPASQRSAFVQSLTGSSVVDRLKAPNPNYTPGGYLPGGSSDAQAQEFARAQSKGVTKNRSVDELMKEFFAASSQNPEAFSKMQEALWAGGFFSSQYRMDEVNWGQADDATTDAYYAAMTLTARRNAAGDDLTVNQVVNDRIENMSAGLREVIMKRSAGPAGRTISLSDPLAIAKALDTVSTQTVGRKATADEQRMFTVMFHSLQEQAQAPGGGYRTSPDIGGQAESFMRTQQPMQAAAKDISNTMNSFLQVIGYKGV